MNRYAKFSSQHHRSTYPRMFPLSCIWVLMSLLKKKHFALRQLCVLEQRSKESAKQWTLSVFPQCFQWVEFPVFPYEGRLLAVRSADSAGESGKI